MWKVLFGLLLGLTLYACAVEAAPVNVCGSANFGNCVEPTAAGAVTEMPADAVNFNNSTLVNGTVVNGLFSSGSVVNPSTNQVLIGPIDTTGAESFEFTQTFTSGSGVVVQMQESASASGPWISILGLVNSGISQNTNLTNFPSAVTGTFSGPLKGRYVQVVATTGGTETLSINGYLRAAPFSNTIAAPLFYTGSAAVQLNGSAGNFAAAPVAITSTKYMVVAQYSIPELTWQYSTNGTAITTNTTTTLQGAQAASVRNYLTGITCDNSGTGAATELQILDGAAVIFDGFIGAASATLNDPHWSATFPVPLRGSAATAMSLKTVTTGASLWCSAQGFAAY